MAQLRTRTAASLFCGVGGLEWGFVRAGVQVASAWDLSSAARATYEANLGICPRGEDLSRVRAADLGQVDFIFAGPPCQGFSALAGKGESDPRNLLIVATARLVATVRPSGF